MDELAELAQLMEKEFGPRVDSMYSTFPNRTSIRLLDVSQDLDPNDRIQCQIKIVDLNHAPKYSALSYTWGDPGANPDDEHIPPLPPGKDEYEILCDGHPLKVTKNCYAFLLSFRKAKATDTNHQSSRKNAEFIERTFSSYLIWIDAICINQSSLGERSSQVRIMDRIYRQAQQVIVWLGPSDSSTKLAVQVIANLANIPIKKCRELFMTSPLSTDPYERLGIPTISKKDFMSVKALLERSWFARSWTVQEYVLARDTVLFCGTLILPFRAVPDAARNLALLGWDHLLASLGDEDIEETDLKAEESVTGTTQMLRGLHNSKEDFFLGRATAKSSFVGAILSLHYLKRIQAEVSRERWLNTKDNIPLQMVLLATTHKQCFNPVDKIYAFLGLLPEASWDGLVVDYSMATQDVYIQATRAMMRATQSLSILSYVEERPLRTISDLPSWVPDFNAVRSPLPLDWGLTTYAETMIPISGQRMVFFNVSLSTPFSIEPNNDSNAKLSVKGMWYDKVVETSRFIPGNLQELAPLLDVITSFPRERLWRTLLADEHVIALDSNAPPVTFPAQEIDGQMFAYYLSQTQWLMLVELNSDPATIETHDDDSPENSGIPYALREYDVFEELIDPALNPIPRFMIDCYDPWIETLNLPQDIKERGLQRMAKALSVRMLDRVLLTTEKRRYGTGMMSTKKGDEIWVLAGAKVPYILRPKGYGEYEFVGEAYMHDIMYGEFVVEKEHVWSDITLV
ncbi:HET-domain-containing protein [Massarina eburnea CBS 473.64]|uniref:HET-domain-containing protein n=1 Tax=Massarina eburnea CBS 473.64 TaxID=1395130 RepID=A0A6A6RND5_9PLEO|nr:HET-domain-containing protein [Massarina eburnea CBS 473.64]